MSKESLHEIDTRVKELDELFKQEPTHKQNEGEGQYWEDRKEERRLLLEKRKSLMPN